MRASQLNCDFLELAADGVRKLQPYLPGKPISELEREYGVSNIIKLASNENPLGASPLALEAMRRGLDEVALYPDGGGYDLKDALAARHGVPRECITLGNGSNDVLVLAAEAFLKPGLEAVFSQFCFAVYPIAVEAVGATARIAPALPPEHEQSLGHDLQAMADRVGQDTRLVFIANPNNPTGTWVDPDQLHDFVSALPRHTLAVVDEAYFEYARPRGLQDATRWLEQLPNLIVARTFSKVFGLAGIRVGYCLSSPAVADLLNRIRQPFNVNSLALLGAQAALEDTNFVQRSVELNNTGLERLKEGLSTLGVTHSPSAGNFVLADMGLPAMPVYESLLRAGVIVRPVGNYGLPNHLRITVGTEDQNGMVLKALGRSLREGTRTGA